MRIEGIERLSLDIYMVIIESLSCAAPAERECLENLSLTCSILRPFCQKALFCEVTIEFHRGACDDVGVQRERNRILGFLELANDSPVPLARYILSLHIALHDCDQQVIEDLSMVPQFLSTLENVKILRLTGYSRREHIVSEDISPMVDWPSLGQPAASALADIITSPLLRSLYLDGLSNFPSRILSSLKESRNINDVSIGDLQLDEEIPQSDTANSHDESSCPQILKYHVKIRCQPVSSLFFRGTTNQRPVFDFTQLKHLSVEWSKQSEIEDTKALMHIARGIETLQCECMYLALLHDSKPDYQTSSNRLVFNIHEDVAPLSFNGLAEMILFGSFLTLRSLEVHILSYGHHRSDPFHSLIQELEKLSGNSERLENITIYVYNDIAISGEWEDRCISLDRLFPAAFPRLQKLWIVGDASIYDYDDEEREAIETQFEKEHEEIKERCFSNISAIPRIDFKFEISPDIIV